MPNDTSARPKLIAFEDDPKVLRDIQQAVGDHLQVIATRDDGRVIALLHQDPAIRILVAAQFSGPVSALGLLEKAREIRADVRRVLLTAYSDLSGIIQGLHSGAVQYVIQKPCSPRDLLAAFNLTPSRAVPAA